MNPRPSFQIMLDDRRADADDKYPVVLYLYFNRKKKLYPIGMKLTQVDWDNSRKKKPLEEFIFKKEKIDLYEHRAKKIIEVLDDSFSFERFEEKWNQKILTGLTVLQLCAAVGKQKRIEGKISTARGYEQAGMSMDNFKHAVTLKDITIDFLKDYEKWMLGKKLSKTTIGMYLRNIKALINSDPDYDKKDYPFGDKKYSIPKGNKGKTTKKHLNLNEIDLICNYQPKTERLKKGKIFNLMIYFGGGINPVDICNLKWANIFDDEIKFHRTKTELTIKGELPLIILPINEEIRTTIDTYGIPGDEKDYIFPIFRKGLDAEEKWRLKDLFVRFLNDTMDEIRKELKISKKVTTYTMRRSYGTNLIKQGVNPIFVQRQFGHTKLSTTEDYIGDFSVEEIKEISEKLKPNKKPKT